MRCLVGHIRKRSFYDNDGYRSNECDCIALREGYCTKDGHNFYSILPSRHNERNVFKFLLHHSLSFCCALKTFFCLYFVQRWRRCCCYCLLFITLVQQRTYFTINLLTYNFSRCCSVRVFLFGARCSDVAFLLLLSKTKNGSVKMLVVGEFRRANLK